MGGHKTRTRSSIDLLPEADRQFVHEALLDAGNTYDDIEEMCRTRGLDISRSSIGRYGQRFLNEVRSLKIATEQAGTLVSEAGDDPDVLLEAANKMLAGRIIEGFVGGQITLKNVTSLSKAVAMLQSASAIREKTKETLRGRADKAVQSIETATRGQLTPETIQRIKEDIYGIFA